jgi:hypothetical protein
MAAQESARPPAAAEWSIFHPPGSPEGGSFSISGPADRKSTTRGLPEVRRTEIDRSWAIRGSAGPPEGRRRPFRDPGDPGIENDLSRGGRLDRFRGVGGRFEIERMAGRPSAGFSGSRGSPEGRQRAFRDRGDRRKAVSDRFWIERIAGRVGAAWRQVPQTSRPARDLSTAVRK